jgi:hypothetical protein
MNELLTNWSSVSSEAGNFISWLAGSKLVGSVNACSKGTITLEEIFTYIQNKTGKKPVLNTEAEEAPYNGGEDFSLNTQKAEEVGYSFSELNSWIFKLLDHYIIEAMTN